MTPEQERRLQVAAATLTAHYYDPETRDRLLRSLEDPARAFTLLDEAAAHVAAPAVKQDAQRWLSAVASGEPGIERSVIVFAALAEDTGIPPEEWAKTFALAASPPARPAGTGPTATRSTATGPARPY